MKAPIVILGSGLAGITVLRELRKIDKHVPVLVVTADDGAFYSKPSLSSALASGKTAAQLVLNSAEQLSAQLNAEFRTLTSVLSIKPEQHALVTDRGMIGYSKLVVALGANPIPVPISGSASDEVISVNHLRDYAGFRDRLDGARNVAIMGGGLIGCEFANDLAAIGVRSTIYDRASHALGRLLPEQSARFFEGKLQSIGVSFRFSTTVTGLDHTGDTLTLTDSQGKSTQVDLLLSAVGLRPVTQLAEAAGLTVNRGIMVNRQLATSHPDIYALGDCAEVNGLVLPFVMPVMHAARALAKTLCNESTEVVYPAMPVAVKTPACPTVVCPPLGGVAGEWLETSSGNGVRAIYRDADGIMQGFALLGDAVQEKQSLLSELPAWL